MKNPCKEYHVVLEVLGPVHVGNGRELDKKSYIFTDKKHIAVIDLEKLYAYLSEKKLAQEYEKFLLRGQMKLKEWLEKQNISYEEISPCVKYRMNCGDAIQMNSPDIHISEQIKDPYCKPYIPGSSIKGMLRTILLADDILVNSEKHARLKNTMGYNISSRDKVSRKEYLLRNMAAIECEKFHTLKRDEKNRENAVNDMMSGIIVSDSEALEMDSLVLCKKVEGHVDGKDHVINTLRECIRPGTKIRFTITVDETVTDLTVSDICQAVERFAQNYNQCFVEKFQGTDPLPLDCVVLGGGSGFVSKTIIYPMFGEKEGVRKARDIFFKTVAGRNSKHASDLEAGVSPHIIKYTQCNGKRLQMGVCRFVVES